MIPVISRKERMETISLFVVVWGGLWIIKIVKMIKRWCVVGVKGKYM